MADTEHYVREDVRGFLDMLEAMGTKGVEEVGAVEGREQMRTLGRRRGRTAPDGDTPRPHLPRPRGRHSAALLRSARDPRSGSLSSVHPRRRS